MKTFAKLLSVPALCIVPFALHAVCPICTGAMAIGLEGMRFLGVDDLITGVWAGGLVLSLTFWTTSKMHKKGVKNPLWYLLVTAAWLSLLPMMWLLPNANPFGVYTFLGVDKFLFGIISGMIAFYIAAKWHHNIKKRNGGQSWFPLQKVVWPVGAMLIVSGIFYGALQISGTTASTCPLADLPPCEEFVEIEQLEITEPQGY
jgi:hypothetical protein